MSKVDEILVEDFEYIDQRLILAETDIEELYQRLERLEKTVSQAVQKVNLD